MSSFAQRLRNEETGASLILVTLSLFVLMGFAAFAVDAAAARSQRRENQGAADTGGLSAIQLAKDKLQADAIADATNEVIRISYESLFDSPPKPADPTFAEWQAAWASCVDPGGFTLTGTSDCISFTNGLQKLRTRLPDINVDTTFGRVLGRNQIRTGAISVVAVEGNPGTGAILPFGLPGQAAGDSHVCLKTGPNPQSEDPCDGPNSGNFSFLDITQFGFDPNFNTTTQCQGGTNTRLARNIAQGIDHPLKESGGPMAAPELDRALCNNGNFQSRPSTLTTETGNGKGGALMDGLVDGLAGTPYGRITQSGGDEATVGAYNDIDNVPLWVFLNSAGRTLCEPFNGNSPFIGDVDDHVDLIDCIDFYTDDVDGSWEATNAVGAPLVIFNDAVTNPPTPRLSQAERFAWVPLFYDNTLGNGSTDHNIADFRPVYLQTTFWKCNAGGCKFVHDPGETLVSNPGNPNNATIQALTGIQLPLGALPDSISVDGNPSSDAVFVYSLVE